MTEKEDKMNEQEIERFFIESGFNCYPGRNNFGYRYVKLWQKKLDSVVVCETNDRLYLSVHESAPDNYDPSFEVEITAEQDGKWWKLMCYSITFQEIKRDIERLSHVLLSMLQMTALSNKQVSDEEIEKLAISKFPYKEGWESYNSMADTLRGVFIEGFKSASTPSTSQLLKENEELLLLRTEAYNEIQELKRQIKELKNSGEGWISCKKGLPDLDVKVMCYQPPSKFISGKETVGRCLEGILFKLEPNERRGYVDLNLIGDKECSLASGGEFWAFPYICHKNFVTHWQPLPSPPIKADGLK